MKLGTQTASLCNHIMSREVIGQPAPVVGMGATVLSWTDRHAATIIEVRDYGVIVVQRDDAKRVDRNGMSESQTYDYAPNPNGPTYIFKRDRGGAWRECEVNERTGRVNMLKSGYGLKIGVRDTYHDFSF